MGSHIAPRVIAQRGLFTVHGSPETAYEARGGSASQVRKWLIPREQTMRVKVRLDAAGFNRASLFPDIGGVAEYLSWLYKRDLLSGEVGHSHS